MGGYSDYRRNNPFKNQNQCNVTDWFKTGYSSQKQDAGAVIATMAPQMLMSIFSQINEHHQSSETSSNDTQLRNPDEINADIKNVLNKYDINDPEHSDDYNANISDINIQLEQKKNELAKLNEDYSKGIADYNTAVKNRDAKQKELTPLEKEYTEKSNKLDATNKKIEKNKTKIGNLQTQIDDLQGQLDQLGNTEETKKQREQYQKSINDLKKQQEKLKNENKKLGDEATTLKTWITDNSSKIETLKGEVQKYTAEVEKLEKDIAPVTNVKNEIKNIESDLEELNKLKKELKKAEGKDTIEALTNDDTDKISKYVTKLRKAQESGDSAKISEARGELKTALKIYLSNPENVDSNGNAKNKTIAKLLEKEIETVEKAQQMSQTNTHTMPNIFGNIGI